MTDPTQQIPLTEEASPLDEQLDKIAQLVTDHGPKHLIRGMKALEANVAIASCLERLIVKEVVLRKKVETLHVEAGNLRTSVQKVRDERNQISKEIDRLANYLLVDWQDELGKPNHAHGESAVDVALRLLKSYKEVKNGYC